MDGSLPLSIGILQARILERVAMPSSRGSSQPRDQAQSPALQAVSLLPEPPGKPKIVNTLQSIKVNTFLPMRNKSVYSCSIKIHTSGFDELLESIFCLLLVVEAFFMPKVVRMLGGSPLVRGQVNMADEAKLHSPIHSTFEVLVV